MKNPTITLLFVLPTLLCLNFTALSQDSPWKLGTGVGFIDGVHISISRTVSEKNEFGFQMGTIPTHFIIIPAFEYKLYIGESSKREKFMTWYMGNKLLYYYEKNSSKEFHEIHINTSVGKNFYLSERFGLNTEIGILYKLYDMQVYTEFDYDDEPDRFRILPSLRVKMYYTF